MFLEGSRGGAGQVLFVLKEAGVSVARRGHVLPEHLPCGGLSQGGLAAAAGVPPGSALLKGLSDWTFQFREKLEEEWKELLLPSLLGHCPSPLPP